MARPIVIRDAAIIEAAQAVFLERGFRATTAEVAERAGISEGSIFKRFRTKFELFRAAMSATLEEPAFVRELPSRVGVGSVQESLVALGLDFVAHQRALTPLMMMAWSNPGEDGLPCIASEPDPPPMRMLKAVSGYFEAEMRLGRLRRHDAEIVARTFLGALHNYVVFELIFRSNEQLPLPAETFVRGLVQLLWVGAAPGPRAEVSPSPGPAGSDVPSKPSEERS